MSNDQRRRRRRPSWFHPDRTPLINTLIISTRALNMLEETTPKAPATSYMVVLSGTHVTGKETIAVSLSKSLNCPWLKGEFVHTSAWFAARAQERRGQDRSTVYGRQWFTKMQRQFGLLSDIPESNGGKAFEPDPKKSSTGCIALVTIFALRKQGRDAIREVMLERSVRVIFVVLQITKDTLDGRTLGAEEPDLAETIMESKREDIRLPEVEERDVLVVDSMQDVDALTLDIEERVRRQVEGG
ncbi:uncharacterized protein PAC_18088 [Phialocephala subalpina]|uniref:Uncharacterized protein n=1 Tax=Phialocephala subalpina TaxID=576137 RepID=A0A1L7XT42_9HELO|nr:uncharacterized protein PAC_18088 [Phialocephala subalpina]